jgi:hypothetical protein
MAFELQSESGQPATRGITRMENLDFSRDQSEIELTLPHFDDEETIQSARPVVPLHEVKRASQTKQRLLLGGALCVAAVVGALTASWIGGPQPVQEPSTATNETSPLRADFVTPSSEAGGATVDPNEAVALESEATDNGAGDLTVESNAPTVRRPLNKNTRTPQKVEKAIPPQVSDSDSESVFSDEDLLRERRREERRLRRERRIEERRSDDGLTRIREIFEGSPRP